VLKVPRDFLVDVLKAWDGAANPDAFHRECEKWIEDLRTMVESTSPESLAEILKSAEEADERGVPFVGVTGTADGHEVADALMQPVHLILEHQEGADDKVTWAADFLHGVTQQLADYFSLRIVQYMLQMMVEAMERTIVEDREQAH